MSWESAIFLMPPRTLRTQILSTPLLAPAQPPRDTPIAGVLLTSADVDSVAGLLHLREFQPLHIYATPFGPAYLSWRQPDFPCSGPRESAVYLAGYSARHLVSARTRRTA